MAENKVVHAAQRAAFSVAIDAAIKAVRGKGTEHMTEEAVKLINLAEPLLSKRYKASAFDAARKFVQDPNGKWMEYAYRAINEIDPHILKMNVLNLGYEGMFSGYNYVMELRKKYDCNMPWILLFDPTASCNLHCKGCWAAEYGKTLNLTYEEMDKLVTEGEELGIHWYMCTGGEPMCRKNDLLKLAAAHQNSVFHLFTNGTLIDEAFADDMLRVGNFAPAISVEGYGEETDMRRGKGTFKAVMKAMEILKRKRLLFGMSTCYHRKNVDVVGSSEYLDFMIDQGAAFVWYFTYMPVGNDAVPELMVTSEQRKFMYEQVRMFRKTKPIFAMDFWNDGEYVRGCIAGGRYYFHINANGDVEPCAFIHYSTVNIKQVSLLEALRSPLFKAYQQRQPFNKNHLRPCPLLDNPHSLKEVVRVSEAYSTDMLKPEDVDVLTGKCVGTAEKWGKVADHIWYGKNGTEGQKEEKQLETEKSAEKRKGNEVKDKERETSEQKQEKEKALSV